jgi:phenylalanyl-tRNA synthetase beta chain
MLVPVGWLKEYVDLEVGLRELTEKLTMSGSNVEGLKFMVKDLNNIVIGRVKKVFQHPDASKLLVVNVDVGNNELQIVTGATNVKENDMVPVALSGATIQGGKHIDPAEFRGIKSDGMLCSAKELGIDDNGLSPEIRDGILILPQDSPVGYDVKKYLGLEDAVIDFEITPNRPDCLSIIGIAREAAATLKAPFNVPEIKLKDAGKEKAESMVQISIEAEDLCSRYVAKIVKDVKIAPSPLWMQLRLQACGIRPINNIVDITNYVMMEMGQPLHAFDYDKVRGNHIIIRRGRNSEKMVTLDGIKRDISEEILVIADKNRPIALAGVMGGEETEIDDTTKTILIESANFSGPNIRKTSRKLGLRSEASMRFEKGIDPNICNIAADRACQLIEDLGIGTVLKGNIDVYVNKANEKIIRFSHDRMNRTLGTDISQEEVIQILERLDIRVMKKDEEYFAVIPTFRSDISQQADLVEEVGRIYGYDKLPSTLPQGDATKGKLSLHQKFSDDVKQLLTNIGFSEVYTYSFVSPKVFDKMNTPKESELRKAVIIKNPLGEDQSVMRTTLIPTMLEIVKYNFNQRVENVKLFEIGAIYRPREIPLKQLPIEDKKLGLCLCGKSSDFFDLKRTIETIFAKLRIEKHAFLQDKHFAFHPGRFSKIVLNGGEVGFAGELHPDVLENYEIDEHIYMAELSFDLMLDNASNIIEFKPLPKYPSSERDLAIIVEDSVPAGDIIEEIRKASDELLEKVELFDVYKGGQIPTGFKSLAFSLVYRASEKTLTDLEVNEIHNKVKARLEEKFNGTLRE